MSLWKPRCRLHLPFLLFRRFAEGKEENGAVGKAALAGCGISCGCTQEVRSRLHPSLAQILMVQNVPWDMWTWCRAALLGEGACTRAASFSSLLLSYRDLHLRGLLPDINQGVLKGSAAACLTKKEKKVISHRLF